MNYQYDRYWGTFSRLGTNGVPETSILAVGYSGRGPALNDPSDESQHAVGPIPSGWFTIDGPFNMGPKGSREHESLGAGPVWKLIPDDATRTKMISEDRDPDSFYAHGDNSNRNHSASEGCIIVPPFYRGIFMKGDRIRVL